MPLVQPPPVAAAIVPRPSSHGALPPSVALHGAAGGRRFGRWQLGRMLGRSATSMAWLATDLHSGDESLLYLPRTRPEDAAAVAGWLEEARRMARLAHPRLAAALKVDAPDGWPCVVVDRRLGLPFADWRAAHPAASTADCIALVVQALEGLAYAHEAGLLHGDLQPWHCLIDDQGQLRLAAFDFRILQTVTVRAADPAQRRATRDGAARDVFAAGLLLHGLLAGRPALDEPDLALAADRLPPHGREAVRLPRLLPRAVPDALRAIADRATAYDPRQRYLNARTLLAALDGWRQGDADADGGPLGWLLDRIRSAGFLPASPGTADRVARLLQADGAHAAALAARLLVDPALTIELLRQANWAQVRGRPAGSGEPVLALSRAVGLLGTDGVRRATADLRNWPGVAGPEPAAGLLALIERVRRAGRIAQALRPPGYDAEAVYAIAVLQNLGRLLVQYHFPEQAGQIRQLMCTAAPSARRTGAAADAETTASYAVLGTDAGTLGIAVAQQWGLPPAVTTVMRRCDMARPVGLPEGDWALLRAAASAANEAVDAMPADDEDIASTAGQTTLAMVAQRYARALRMTPLDLQAAVRVAAEDDEDVDPSAAPSQSQPHAAAQDGRQPLPSAARA